MLKILILLLILFANNTYSQENINTEAIKNTNTSAEGWYWDTALRGAWNFAGACYRNKIYYKKSLNPNSSNFLLKDSYIDMGVEIGLAPFIKAMGYITWQPILPFKVTAKVGYYKDLIGDVFVDGPDGDYNQGYLAFTGLKPEGVTPRRFTSDGLEIELTPVLTLGGVIKETSALALIYAPSMFYYHSFDNTSPDQYRYRASESIVYKKNDLFWKHNLLLAYQYLPYGLTVGASATIQHVQSIDGIFRAGVFGVLAYEKAVASKPYLTPYVRTQIGTWVRDRYLKNLFVIQFEVGLKYKFS